MTFANSNKNMSISGKFRLLGAVFILVSLFSAPLAAQNNSWIQLETLNSLAETKTNAQSFARDIPETKAYLTSTGVYAIAIGPLTGEEAFEQLRRLQAQNLIPRDAFVTQGETYKTQFWPIASGGAVQATEEVAQADQPAPATESTSDPAPEADQTEEPAPASSEPEVVVATPIEPTEEEKQNGPIPDPDLRATRALERSWNREQKMDYQRLLVWTGDYEAAIDGSYGRGTRAAIRSFQKREGFEETGFLTERQTALLVKRQADMAAFLGMDTIRDTDAGIELPMPTNLITFDRIEPPFIYYRSKNDSDVRVILISQTGGREVMVSLYDIIESFDYVPPTGYRVKKRDWLVLSGRDDTISSYTFAKTQNGLVKGFTLIWPTTLEKVMRPMVTAMYEQFTPLDEYVLDETIGYGQNENEPVDLTNGIDTPEPRHSASGFFVNSQGVIATHYSNIDGCTKVTMGDGHEPLDILARNKKLELAILKPKGPFSPDAYARFSNETPEIATDITVAGFSFPDVMETATLNYGTLTDTHGMLGDPATFRVSAFLELGDVGGPVLDDRGAVVGLLRLRGEAAATLPEYVNFALRNDPILEMLERHEIPYEIMRSLESADPEDRASMAAGFTTKIGCWN